MFFNTIVNFFLVLVTPNTWVAKFIHPDFTFLQIEREVEEDPESPSFKENKNPISSVTGDKEENKTKEEDLATIAANAVMYSEKLQQKKEALLKRIAKLQKECYEYVDNVWCG